MIYSAEHNLTFVHIPKAAGTSIRKQIVDFAKFPREAFLADLPHNGGKPEFSDEDFSFRHPEIGDVKLDHLPLTYLHRYFPTAWKLLENSQSFAVVRNPRNRFISGIAQRLREFRQVRAYEVDDTSIRKEAESACTFLESNNHFCDREYIHLTRQADFIFLNGARVTKKLFVLEKKEQVETWLSERLNGTVELPEENETIKVRGGFDGAYKRFVPIYRRIAPAKLRDRLRPIFRKSPIVNTARSSYEKTFLGNDVESFIRRYYHDDFEIYSRLMKSGQAGGRAS